VKAALRRAAVALTGLLLASGGLGLLAASPAASRPTAGACTDTAGVTVVVDFGSAGGGVKTGCAAAPLKNGFEALVKAGFDITNVRSQPGFLCQIDARPTSDCRTVPNASHYWSYWHAARGGSWTYSSSGASRTPPAGSVEGWSFGASQPPGAAPPGPIVTTTTTRATSSTTSPPTTTNPVVTAPGATTTSVADDATDTTVATATTATTAVGEGSAVDPTTSTRRPSSDDADTATEEATAASAADEGGGSPAGLLVAVGLIVGLGWLGVGTARRRARAAESAG